MRDRSTARAVFPLGISRWSSGNALTQKAGRMCPARGLLEWVLDLPDNPGRSDRAFLNLLDGPTLRDQIEHADPRRDVVLVCDLLGADQEWNVYLPCRDEGTHGDTIGPHQDHQTGYPAPGLPHPPVQVANQLSRFIAERPDEKDDGLVPATDLEPVNDSQPVFQRQCRRFHPGRQRRPGGSRSRTGWHRRLGLGSFGRLGCPWY